MLAAPNLTAEQRRDIAPLSGLPPVVSDAWLLHVIIGNLEKPALSYR